MIAHLHWLNYEKELWSKGFKCLAGIDEAGRGPLAGPVVAGCVHMPADLFIEGIDDSKKLTDIRRRDLFKTLTSTPEIVIGIGIIHADEIDKINILQATLKAMQQAYEQMTAPIDHLLVDGVQLNLKIPSKKIIKGDALSHLIAAASIIAKVTRDQMMLEYHKQWPEYGFNAHKGYGTMKHLKALKELGPCPIHRKTFEPIRSLISERTVLLSEFSIE